MKRIIIDCDAGVDDALALILAFHSPELNVLGVTGINGNVSVDKVMVNIKKVLSLIAPPGRPLIARGADRPLRGEPVYAEAFHGKDGLGGAKIEAGDGGEYWETYPGPAGELIPEMARRHPGEITLAAIGPLTNIALAVQKDSDGMRRLKEIVIMGGAVREKGNITASAEFNFFADPLAAGIVLESGIPATLVPLDATHQIPLTPGFMETRIAPLAGPFSRFVLQATGFNPRDKQFRRRREVFYLHDPLAVGAVIDTGLVRKERLSISVETREGNDYGRSFESPTGSPADVCLGAEREKFLELFVSRLEV